MIFFLGGEAKNNWFFKNFISFIKTNEPMDLGSVGKPWIWCSLWDKCGVIKERLDRILASVSLFSEFVSAKVVHIENYASDHCMVMLDCKKDKRRILL